MKTYSLVLILISLLFFGCEKSPLNSFDLIPGEYNDVNNGIFNITHYNGDTFQISKIFSRSLLCVAEQKHHFSKEYFYLTIDQEIEVDLASPPGWVIIWKFTGSGYYYDDTIRLQVNKDNQNYIQSSYFILSKEQ